MRIIDIKNKTVINEPDCKIIGYVIDVDFDIKRGCINSLIVPGPCRFGGLWGRDFEYIIPFECICSIGPDVILVNVCLNDVREKCL